MSVYKCHAFIFLDQPPPWLSRTLMLLKSYIYVYCRLPFQTENDKWWFSWIYSPLLIVQAEVCNYNETNGSDLFANGLDGLANLWILLMLNSAIYQTSRNFCIVLWRRPLFFLSKISKYSLVQTFRRSWGFVKISPGVPVPRLGLGFRWNNIAGQNLFFC